MIQRRRVLVVVVALALGALAGGVAYTYLGGVQRRAYQNAELTSVYVASGPIPIGMSGATATSAGLIKKVQMPVEYRPVGAIESPTEVASDVALSNIATEQVIVSTLFGEQRATGGAAAQLIPPHDVAVSIAIDGVHGVSGLIEPGDDVDVMVEPAPGSREELLYQDVQVLAIGGDLATGSSGSTTSVASSPQGSSESLVTFAVPLDAAERLALAESGGGIVAGSIYLALVPPGSPASSVAPVGTQNLIPSTPTPK